VKPKPARSELAGETLDQAALPGQPADAFEALFDQHWNRVCGVLFRLTGDPAEAEDLALEAFWRLYRRPPQDQNLAGWLYRVATRLGLNALRSRKRRRLYEEEAGTLDAHHRTWLDPAAAAELAEQRRSVREVLAGMHPRSAQLLVLRHSGLAYAEIAAALGVAPTSIGTLLARAEADFEKRYREKERRRA
jgi:RNA polymerase sigma-70 factor (ECF subfamily)